MAAGIFIQYHGAEWFASDNFLELISGKNMTIRTWNFYMMYIITPASPYPATKSPFF